MLIIDLIDAVSKELVWRGVARGKVGSGDPESRVNEAVQAILDEYPPRK